MSDSSPSTPDMNRGGEGRTMIEVRVDHRESPKSIIAIRDSLPAPTYSVSIDVLNVGDIVVNDTLGIEHKTPSDFWGSVRDRRIFAQATELREAYPNAFIVVSGTLDDVCRASGGQESAALGAVTSLLARYKIPVVFAGERFSEVLVKLVEKTTDGRTVEYNPIRKNATSKQIQEHLLASIPGVGPKRAKAILAHYGGPLAALNAVDSWVELDGIGQKTVDGVRLYLDGPVTESIKYS